MSPILITLQINFIFEEIMSLTRIETIDQLKTGNFVKFIGRDKQGKFSYLGEVINIKEGDKKKSPYFEILTFEGIMGFILDDPDSNELYLSETKPQGWAKFKKDPKSFKENQQQSNKTITPTKTKKELVFDLVTNNPKKKEVSLLELAKKEIGGIEQQLKNYIKLALKNKK